MMRFRNEFVRLNLQAGKVEAYIEAEQYKYGRN